MKHDYTLFRKSRWLWLLTLLMLVPIGSWAQNDTDYELVIEMRDGKKHFTPINDNYPILETLWVQIEGVSVPCLRIHADDSDDWIEIENYKIAQMYTQVASFAKITAKSYTITRGDAIPTFEYEATGVPIEGTPVLTCEATSSSPAGVYDIVVSRGTITHENLTLVNGTLTIIDPGIPVEVKAQDITMVYGDPVPTFTYTMENGTVEGTPELSCDVTSTTTVGTYPIMINKGSITSDNISLTPGTLTITKAPLTITSKDYSIDQYEPLPDKYELEFSGFKNGETKDVLLSQPQCYAKDEEHYSYIASSYIPGKYLIDIVGADATNYEITYQCGYLTIVEAPEVTIRAKSYAIDYGDEMPEPEYTVEGGKIYGEPGISIICPSNPANAGEYEIRLDKNTVENEKLNLINGKLVVSRVPLTVTAKSYTINKGESLPDFECDYSGFKGSDSQWNSFTTFPEITTTATFDSPAGEYPIIVSGGVTNNYNVTYVNGVLTIKDPTGIDTIDAEAGPVDVYTSAGTLVARGLTSDKSLTKGVYIVKTANGKTFKLTRK